MDEAKRRAVEFGKRLRKVRQKGRQSLRMIERRSGLNSGYLSQLENGKITHPSPSVLQKVASGYELRFQDLLQWTGYVTDAQDLVTPNQAVALSSVSALGEPSDEELETLKAIVDLLQSKRSATFAAPSDLPLDHEAISAIRGHALAILRQADGLGRRPTPLEDIQGAARLVMAGEVTLDTDDRARLFERFGKWVSVAWSRLPGTFDFRTSEIWVAPDLHDMKRRFVVSHEIGHAILPAHKQTFAVVDDFTCLPPFARDLFEREANQAAAEILFQGGQAAEEFDSSPASLGEICRIASGFGASIVSTARYAVETSKRPIAIAIAHRNSERGLGPTHIYASARFESLFGWRAGQAPWGAIRAALNTANDEDGEAWVVENLRHEPRIVDAQKMSTGYASIVLVVPDSRTRAMARKLVPVPAEPVHLSA